MCLAQGQHMYFLKAKLSNFKNSALMALLKVSSDKYLAVKNYAEKARKYFPSGLIRHFEVGRMDMSEISFKATWLLSALFTTTACHFWMRKMGPKNTTARCIVLPIVLVLGSLAGYTSRKRQGRQASCWTHSAPRNVIVVRRSACSSWFRKISSLSTRCISFM